MGTTASANINNNNNLNFNKMTLITRVPLGAIRILEYPEFANGVLDIVEKHDPAKLKIEGVTNLLKAEVLEVDKITVTERRHPMTKELKTLRSSRDKTLGAILSLIQGYGKVQVSPLKEAADVALPFLNRFFTKVHKNTNFVKNKKINLLLEEMDGNAELQTALSTLGFTVLLDELKTIYLAIIAKQTSRRKVKSETPRVIAKQIMVKATIAMNNMFKTIEISQLVEQNLDYLPLINELNEMLSEYKFILTQRRTLNFKAGTKKTAVASSTKTTATTK